MKTIGLLGGMSWESTQLYYRLINEGVRAQLGKLHSAEIVLYSVDFEPIEQMHLEHYPGMTEKYLQELAALAMEKWQLADVLIVHRVGDIHPADTIVVVAVWSAHRAQAYEANRHIMEELKSHAPFWKKEQMAKGGSRWLEKNTPGHV